MATLALNDLRISLVNATKDHFLCSDTCGRVLTLMLGEERRVIAHAHLNTHLKSILSALLSRSLSITTAHHVFGLKSF